MNFNIDQYKPISPKIVIPHYVLNQLLVSNLNRANLLPGEENYRVAIWRNPLLRAGTNNNVNRKADR
jgi:hypothetical protein